MKDDMTDAKVGGFDSNDIARPFIRVVSSRYI